MNPKVMITVVTLAIAAVIVVVAIGLGRKRARRISGAIPAFDRGFTDDASFTLKPPSGKVGASGMGALVLVWTVILIQSTAQWGFIPGMYIFGVPVALACLWSALYMGFWRVDVEGASVTYPTWIFITRKTCSISDIMRGVFKANGGLKVFVKGKHAFTIDQVGDGCFGSFTQRLMHAGVAFDDSRIDAQWQTVAREMEQAARSSI